MPLARKRLYWAPTWTGELSGYAMNYAARNAWRVSPEYDVEDLFQEFYLIFERLRENYPHVATPQHFMSLFKVSLRNFVHSLASKRTRKREVQPSMNEEGEELFELLPAAQRQAETLTDYLAAVLEIAPPEVHQMLLTIFRNEDVGGVRIVNGQRDTTPEHVAKLVDSASKIDRPKVRRRCGRRETTNQYLCRLAGADAAKIDLEKILTALVGCASVLPQTACLPE